MFVSTVVERLFVFRIRPQCPGLGIFIRLCFMAIPGGGLVEGYSFMVCDTLPMG